MFEDANSDYCIRVSEWMPASGSADRADTRVTAAVSWCYTWLAPVTCAAYSALRETEARNGRARGRTGGGNYGMHRCSFTLYLRYKPNKPGKGLGKVGSKRHRKLLRDNIQGITKPAIHRLARGGGVKRISGLTFEETHGVLKVFLENVIQDAVTYTEPAKGKTATTTDVV
ncbi:hypothetical protein NDU88_004454 [Pleurodeles waltl]|uniref:Histone H4 n=1 Tax=Pleurodeles waltl TaxID=8319 RepID=A0AAV7SIT9_PLEWA|nr:hypothetical protein NDU88_004454 [Pleurodeles waltl]